MAIGDVVPKEPTVVEPETGEKPVIKVEPPQKTYETKKHLIRGKQVLWYSWMVIEVLLLFRFLLKLFGANSSSGFAILVDTLSLPFRFLFTNLFPPTVSPIGNIIVEWSILFAMLVYALLSLIIAKFFKLGKPIDPEEAERKADQTIP